MKKMALFFCLLVLTTTTFACGGITHMFIARSTIPLLDDPVLQKIINDNLDAYLVGAYYPDSGYVDGTGYGEDSHWDPFIFAFADYIKTTYPDYAHQNPKLVAFLFGCAAHRVSDEIAHRVFYTEIENHDFPGDWNAAHTNGDDGIDFLLIIDQDQWFAAPNTWWVPVSDLLQVYHRMGLDQYTADEINHGNSVISLAGTGERAAALAAYPYYRWKMPWTANHYYDWQTGGLIPNEQAVATYQNALWQHLLGKSTKQSVSHPVFYHHQLSQVVVNAETALINHQARVESRHYIDGSITIDPK